MIWSGLSIPPEIAAEILDIYSVPSKVENEP